MAYSVDPAKLEDIGRRLHSTAESIQSEITQLKQQIDALDTEWQGAARTKFDALFLQWHQTNQQNADALITYAQSVARAAQQYQAAEDMNKDLLTGF